MKYWGHFHQNTKTMTEKKWKKWYINSARGGNDGEVQLLKHVFALYSVCAFSLKLLCNTTVLRGNFHLQKMRSKLIRSISHIEQHKNPAVDAMSCTKMATSEQWHTNTSSPHRAFFFQEETTFEWLQSGQSIASWNDKFYFLRNNGS